VTEFQRLGLRSSFQREAGRKYNRALAARTEAWLRSSFQREAGRKNSVKCIRSRCLWLRSPFQREAGRKLSPDGSNWFTMTVAIAFSADGGLKVVNLSIPLAPMLVAIASPTKDRAEGCPDSVGAIRLFGRDRLFSPNGTESSNFKTT